MRRFTRLYQEIDSSTKTSVKLKALTSYLSTAPDEDKLWAIALFAHRRPRRTIQTSFLRTWAAEVSGIPDWLFEESYHIVGDLAESISLILPRPEKKEEKSLSEWMFNIIDQKEKSELEKKDFIIDAWSGLYQDERFIFNKLITGGFRIGVSQKMINKALSQVLDEDENKIAHRLMGDWSPQSTTYSELLLNADWKSDASKPYPFYLAYGLDCDIADIGTPQDWQAEWKWDGIRSQFIKRNGELFLWSRGEELVTDKYPEFQALRDISLENFVFDGELLVFKDGDIRPFNELQKRIGRKVVGKKILKDYPCVIFAYDLLEYEGEDLRDKPLVERQSLLEKVVSKINEQQPGLIYLSEPIAYSSWTDLADIRSGARQMKAEGLMLKQKSSTYRSGRKKGEWWKWKLDPYTIDAVMLYAQRGHGRRSNLFSDFTFAVWKDDDTLVPFAKAYSGLTDKEFVEVTQFVKKNTIEKFGPVRSVKPELVFEIAFEGINISKRHKSGVALRFPRIKRWRRDKPIEEANTLVDLKALITDT